jgi:hypothetical protein
LIALGEKDEILREKINKILDEYAPRRFMTEEIKRNIDTIKNSFKIVKVIPISVKTTIIVFQEKLQISLLKL